MEYVDKVSDALFWAVSAILLLTAISAIVAGAFLTRSFDESASSWAATLIAIGSIVTLASIAGMVYYTIATWDRGNWIKTSYRTISGVPARAQRAYDARLKKLKDEKGRKRLQRQIIRCLRDPDVRAGDEAVCRVIEDAKRQGVTLTTVDAFREYGIKTANENVAADVEKAQREAEAAEAASAKAELGSEKAFAAQLPPPITDGGNSPFLAPEVVAKHMPPPPSADVAKPTRPPPVIYGSLPAMPK